MARLVSPSGVVVDVSDEKAVTLTAIGYKAESKTPAKKAASSKPEK